MNVILNGEPTDLDPGATVRDVLDRLGIDADARGVAVALDSEVVPRSQWTAQTVPDGARVEVLTAVQGG